MTMPEPHERYADALKVPLTQADFDALVAMAVDINQSVTTIARTAIREALARHAIAKAGRS